MIKSKKRFYILLMFIVFSLPALAAVFSSRGRAADIHDAAKTGDLAKVKALLTSAKLVNQKDDMGRTALHWAGLGGHLDVIKYLVKKGADVNLLDKNGYAVLHGIAFGNHKDAAAFLLENGAKIDIKNSRNDTPLQMAAQFGKKETAALLIEKGAALETVNGVNRTPLITTARESGNVEIVRLLLAKGANINAKDRWGATALSLAAWRNFREVVDLLLDKGAEFTTTGEEGNQLLMFAVSRGLDKLFEMMTAKGVDLKVELSNGKTFMHSAAASGSLKIVNMLIKRGFDVNKQDRFGWTPLHHAAFKGRKEAVKLLIKHGAATDTRNIPGKTALNIAAEEKYPEIVKLLTAKGADLSPQKFPKLKGKYLGQKRPGMEPLLFAKGIVSGHFRLHTSIVFSPGGDEAYWAPMVPPKEKGYSRSIMMTSKMKNSRWTAPVMVPIAEKYEADDPAFSADGQKLYFNSQHPVTPAGKGGKENIWVMSKKGAGWSVPKPLPPIINDVPMHWQMSVDKKGNLYFGCSLGGDKGGVYWSKFEKGHYKKPEKVGPGVNETGTGGNGSPFISPNGDYLIFTRMGKGLFISSRKKDGTWSPAKSMAGALGKGSRAVVTPDGKYLFYLAHRNGTTGVYWVDAKIIEQFRSQ